MSSDLVLINSVLFNLSCVWILFYNDIGYSRFRFCLVNKGCERYDTVYCATTGLTGRQPLRMSSGLACDEQPSTECVCLPRQQSECPVSVELIHSCVFFSFTTKRTADKQLTYYVIRHQSPFSLLHFTGGEMIACFNPDLVYKVHI